LKYANIYAEKSTFMLISCKHHVKDRVVCVFTHSLQMLGLFTDNFTI